MVIQVPVEMSVWKSIAGIMQQASMTGFPNLTLEILMWQHVFRIVNKFCL